MHKMFGQDPRSLRPANRDEQNTRFKVWHSWNERRRSSGATSEPEDGTSAVKTEMSTPAGFSHTGRFDDADTLSSPHQLDIPDARFDVTSPTSTLASSPAGPIFSAFPKDDFEAPFPFPLPKPLRNDTGYTTSTQMSTNSIRSLKERLGVSTFFAKQVGVLMRFTVGSSDNLATLSPHRSPSDIPTTRRGVSGPVPHPGLAVPGDFMVAPKYVQSCSRERHFAKYLQEGKLACWCTISDETTDSSENFYVTAKGELCDRALHAFADPTNASGIDKFGNTPAHLFAALETRHGIDATLALVRSRGADSLMANKADQTFLHLLSSVWFTNLEDQTSPLYQLLNLLYYANASAAVFDRDVYGRTFFHQLDRYVNDTHIFSHIAEHYNASSIPRDAFGIKPPSHPTDHLFTAPRRIGTMPLSPLAEEITEEDIATTHQKLITVVNAAYDDPSTEDDEGRNGLQCLAEVSLDKPATGLSNPSSPNPNQPCNLNKRKRGKEDVTKTIEIRAQYLENLLRSTSQATPPDVNHYDKHGRTVLMAFAEHLTDEQDKSGQSIAKMIDLLIHKGAKIDARNSHGQTALLVAAGQGNKHVVSKLLERGANLHARDKKGRGIMAIIDAQISQSSKDLPSYGRLEAVRAAVVAKKLGEDGGRDEPSYLDEWCWQANGSA